MPPSWRSRSLDKLSQTVYDLVVWPKHFLRRLDQAVDFSFINELCAPYYANGSPKGGRPAEEPERVFRALLLLVLYGIPFETALVREIGVNLAFRWFIRLGLLERVFDHSLFYVVRDRLGEEVFEQILTRIFQQCLEQGLIGHQWAFYDYTDVAASAQRYSLYERAVILARAVLRLMEEGAAERGADPSEPPPEASPALRRLVAETAKEVAKAKHSAPQNILRGVARLEATGPAGPAALPQRERAARALVAGAAPLIDPSTATLRATMAQLEAKLPHARGDPDARVGHTTHGTTFCGYLKGHWVDSRYGIIGATQLVPGNAWQADALVGSLVARQYGERVGRAPAQAALDSAFGYPRVVQYLAQEWPTTEVFVGARQPPRAGAERHQVWGAEAFVLTEDNRLLCPNEALSPEQREMQVRCQRRDGTLEYAGRGCTGCAWRSRCTTKAEGPRVVKLHPAEHRIYQAIAAKAQTEAYREALRRRMASSEPVFGHGKSYHGWGRAPYRSRRMNAIMNLLEVIGHNCEKLTRYAPVERERQDWAT
jgi:transposase